MSVDPETGAEDGPYFIIGSSEYTLAGARDLAATLLAAVDAAAHPRFGSSTVGPNTLCALDG
jgi:hypothetical protein